MIAFQRIRNWALKVVDFFIEGAVDAFSRALAWNEGLKFLDVSDNGLTLASADKLFSAWAASTRRSCQPKRHTIDGIRRGMLWKTTL